MIAGIALLIFLTFLRASNKSRHRYSAQDQPNTVLYELSTALFSCWKDGATPVLVLNEQLPLPEFFLPGFRVLVCDRLGREDEPARNRWASLAQGRLNNTELTQSPSHRRKSSDAIVLVVRGLFGSLQRNAQILRS